MIWKLFNFAITNLVFIFLCSLLIPQIISQDNAQTNNTDANANNNNTNNTANKTYPMTLSTLTLEINICKEKNLIDADILGILLRVEIPPQERNVMCALACVFEKFKLMNKTSCELNRNKTTDMYRLFEIPSISNKTIGIIVNNSANELNESQHEDIYKWVNSRRRREFKNESSLNEDENYGNDSNTQDQYNNDTDLLDKDNFNEIERKKERLFKNETEDIDYTYVDHNETLASKSSDNIKKVVTKLRAKKKKWFKRKKKKLDICEEVNTFIKYMYKQKVKHGIFRSRRS